MRTAEEILSAVAAIPDIRRNAVIERIEQNMRPREIAFVGEYCIDFNGARAARAVGIKATRPYLDSIQNREKYASVREAIKDRLAEHSKVSALNAEYVRDYIKSVLELCPTDYFQLGPDGDWTVDPEAFADLPSEIKRLVEGVELKWNGQRKYLSVKFVSKTTVLAMAARYTLVQQVEVATTQVPWEEIAERAGKAKLARIEERIASVGKPNGEHRESERPVLPS